MPSVNSTSSSTPRYRVESGRLNTLRPIIRSEGLLINGSSASSVDTWEWPRIHYHVSTEDGGLLKGAFSRAFSRLNDHYPGKVLEDLGWFNPFSIALAAEFDFPLSEIILYGKPLLTVNRLKLLMKDPQLISGTRSKCTYCSDCVTGV